MWGKNVLAPHFLQHRLLFDNSIPLRTILPVMKLSVIIRSIIITRAPRR